jgi:hypothetical protein
VVLGFGPLGTGEGKPGRDGNTNRWQGLQKPMGTAGSGLRGYRTGPNSKFKFEFKKNEKFSKISKNISRCDESNGVKVSQKFVRLTYFSGI